LHLIRLRRNNREDLEVKRELATVMGTRVKRLVVRRDPTYCKG